MFPYQLDVNFYLRPLIEDDAGPLAALVDKNRVYLKEWLPWLDYSKTEKDSLTFIQSSIRALAEGKTMVLGMWIDSKLAGVVSFNELNWPNKRAVIGYWLDQSLSGKGHTTRAVAALCKMAFGELKLNSVELRAATFNIASRSVAEKLGFAHVGSIPEAEWLYDHFVSHEVFVLTKAKFLLTQSAT